jgi:hypothetical protein
MIPPTKAVNQFPTIKNIKTFIIQGVGSGGDYHNVKGGHWLIDSKISTPMSQYEKYRSSRTTWGINVLGSFCVELEASDGTKGFATGFGGPPACWLVKEHFERFLIGAGKLFFPLPSLEQMLIVAYRSTRHQPHFRTNVPCFHVLWS